MPESMRRAPLASVTNTCGVCQAAPAALTPAARRTMVAPAGAATRQAPWRPPGVGSRPGSCSTLSPAPVQSAAER